MGDGEECVIVAREDSTQVVRAFLDIGARLPLRATSAGVAIMARLEAAEVDRLLRHEFKEFAGTPMPSSEELRRDRPDRRAWLRAQHVVVVPPAVRRLHRRGHHGREGRPVAALALAIPEMRYDHSRRDALARMTVAAADEISRLISSA